MAELETEKIPKSLPDSIEKISDSECVKNFRLQNKSQFVTDVIKKLVREYSERLTHINMHDDHVKILDDGLDKIGRIMSIYFKKGKNSWCNCCEEPDCIRVQYAWKIPDVQKILITNGLKRHPSRV